MSYIKQNRYSTCEIARKDLVRFLTGLLAMDRHVTPEPLPEESPALNPAEPPAAVDIYIAPTSKQQALEAPKALNGADTYVAPRPKKRLPPPPKAPPRPREESRAGPGEIPW